MAAFSVAAPRPGRPQLAFIQRSPDAKQAADRSIALSNIQAIAQRAMALRVLPMRGDPSGCGRKLHNLRQGRISSGMKDEALAIVRAVTGDAPENAEVRPALGDALINA